MNKPKVLQILSTAQPAGASVVSIVATLARRLRQQFTFSAWFLLEDGPLRPELERAGVATRFVPWVPSPRDPIGAIRFWRALHGSSVDLVAQHFGGPRVRWITRRSLRAPIVLHLHGRVAEVLAPTPIQVPTQNADIVIANSQAVANFAQGARVVYPGIELPVQRVESSQRDELVVGTSGRLIALKRIQDLVATVALLALEFPRFRLEIAGDGPELAALKAEANRCGAASKVNFLGWRDDVQQVMHGWDVYVHPSAEEGFGLAILEAMALGLPVVATQVGGVPEMVEDGVSGWLVPPGQPAALAEKIAGLLRDPELRRRMGRQGRQLVAEHFSAERMARDVAGLYHLALSSGSASRAADPN